MKPQHNAKIIPLRTEPDPPAPTPRYGPTLRDRLDDLIVIAVVALMLAILYFTSSW